MDNDQGMSKEETSEKAAMNPLIVFTINRSVSSSSLPMMDFHFSNDEYVCPKNYECPNY